MMGENAMRHSLGQGIQQRHMLLQRDFNRVCFGFLACVVLALKERNFVGLARYGGEIERGDVFLKHRLIDCISRENYSGVLINNWALEFSCSIINKAHELGALHHSVERDDAAHTLRM